MTGVIRLISAADVAILLSGSDVHADCFPFHMEGGLRES